MNIDHLQEFLELANSLNFTKAAKNLHMTQPTLSRHISELEKQVGSPLFIRTSNSVKLTNAGRLLYEKASALISSYSTLMEEVHTETAQKTTTLKVNGNALQPTVNRIFSKLGMRASFEQLPLRFEYYKSRSLSNEIPSPYMLDALKNGEIDLSIETCEYLEELPCFFETLRICDEPLTILASTDNPLASLADLKIEDLFSNTLCAFAVQQHCPKVLFAPFLEAGYDPHHTKITFIDNLMEIPELLGSMPSDMIVPMQMHYCSFFGFDDDSVGKLTTLNINDRRARSGVWAIWRKGEQNQAVLDAIELLKDIVDEAKATATDDQWASNDVLWESAFYPNQKN